MRFFSKKQQNKSWENPEKTPGGRGGQSSGEFLISLNVVMSLNPLNCIALQLHCIDSILASLLWHWPKSQAMVFAPPIQSVTYHHLKQTRKDTCALLCRSLCLSWMSVTVFICFDSLQLSQHSFRSATVLPKRLSCLIVTLFTNSLTASYVGFIVSLLHMQMPISSSWAGEWLETAGAHFFGLWDENG